MERNILILLYLSAPIFGKTILTSLAENTNISTFAVGFTEIFQAIGANSFAILCLNPNKTRKIGEFLKQAHTKPSFQTYLFTSSEQYFKYIEANLKGSMETNSLIIGRPENMIPEIYSRNLAHRLSLYIFYWGSTHINDQHDLVLKEPLRAAYLTHPRRKVYRVYYNQAISDGTGKMKLVNWYDAESLGLYKEPLLPSIETVFKELRGRTVNVPVIHTPPWFFVDYKNNETNMNISSEDSLSLEQASELTDEYFTENSTLLAVNVTGGRDDTLLKLIAEKMHFNISYIDPPERTQGVAIGTVEGNLTFTGGIGMIQRREADLFLGDIPLSWERRQAVEFTFFTLADSGAFVTHAPRKLSETLVLIRPFLWQVWPVLVFTVLVSAPAVYLIVIVPYWWKDTFEYFKWKQTKKHRTSTCSTKTTTPLDSNSETFYKPYIDEITFGSRESGTSRIINYDGVPEGIFSQVTWFLTNLYLRQSTEFTFTTHRARFVTAIIWLGATYVLGDMYSAQLTSQLAKPTKETPINTLSRLEYAMRRKSYLLYVEKGSAAETILENGTGTFQRLFDLMKHQSQHFNDSLKPYEVNSIKEGITSILVHGSRAVLGGRGTLYYNTKIFGTAKFQMSEKLYTRYSAIAVQNGCLFLDSLNSILIRLFEAGILDKMTSFEYEKMFGIQNRRFETEKNNNEKVTSGNSYQAGQDLSGHLIQDSNENMKLQPISVKMLKGSFLILLTGYSLAALILLCEFLNKKYELHEKISKKRKIASKKFQRKFDKFSHKLHDWIHNSI